MDADAHEWWQPVEWLIEGWSVDGRQQELDVLLPGWRANTGLSDGWADALAAVDAAAALPQLRSEERQVLQTTATYMRRRLQER